MVNGLFGSMRELQAINYVFNKNSIQLFILNNITSDYFTTYKNHFDFIIKYYDRYNQLPSKEIFQSKFADSFEWIIVTDSEQSIIDGLKEAKLYRDVISDYKEIGELIKDEKTDKAIEKMASISQNYLKQSQNNCIDLINDANLRYDSYIDRVENPDKSFVTTGIKELDDILGGWDMKNETAAICARTGFGKSWWLIYFALVAAKSGLRVGYYSGEMETDLVGYRLDSFNGNLSNGALTHGNANIKEDYLNYIDSLKESIRGHIYCITPDMFDGSVTVSKLRAFIEKYDLQMLCIDQLSLLDDQKKARNPREQYVNISKDLRALQRLKKIPILEAVQLNREDTTENGPSTKNIAESDRIGQDATTVIFVDRKNDNVIFTIGKSRNARTGDKLTYSWNPNFGTFYYIPTEKDAKSGEDCEKILDEYSDINKSDSVF